jgi:hypothetical protein
MRAIWGIAAVIVLASAASAENGSSANVLFPHCKNFAEADEPWQTFTSGLCAGIIAGIYHTGPNLEAGLKFCPPKGVGHL